jgi:hypothetical protein
LFVFNVSVIHFAPNNDISYLCAIGPAAGRRREQSPRSMKLVLEAGICSSDTSNVRPSYFCPLPPFAFECAAAAAVRGSSPIHLSDVHGKRCLSSGYCDKCAVCKLCRNKCEYRLDQLSMRRICVHDLAKRANVHSTNVCYASLDRKTGLG